MERAMVVSYTLPIVTFVLSLTIQPQFAIKSLQRSRRLIQQGHLGLYCSVPFE